MYAQVEYRERDNSSSWQIGDLMTDAQRFKEISKAIKAYTKEHARTPETARAALIREGIYDKKGRLKDKYNEALDYQSVNA